MKKLNLDATNSEVSEIEITYKTKSAEKTKIMSSRDAYNVFKSVYDFNKIAHKEMFYAMYLNRNNKVLGVLLVSEGGTSSTVVDPKIVFQGALKLNASGIILSHNHPSGNMKASNEDIAITKKLKEGARLLDFSVLDHVILSPEENIYLSMADECLF